MPLGFSGRATVIGRRTGGSSGQPNNIFDFGNGMDFLSAPSDSIFPTDRPIRAWGLHLISKCRGRLSLSSTTQTKRLRERFKQPDQRHLDELLWIVPRIYLPEQARALAERLEIHYMPKHGSWLNIAEIELSALCGQRLNQRMPDLAIVSEQMRAWEQRRNNRDATVDWPFTTRDARIKLSNLSQKLQSAHYTGLVECSGLTSSQTQSRLHEFLDLRTSGSRLSRCLASS